MFPSQTRRPLTLFLVTAATSLACGDDTMTSLDASPAPMDSGVPADTGSGEPDLGSAEDTGPADTGSGDAGEMDAGGIDPMTEPYRTLRNTGLPADRIDIVFIGDGYTIEELPTAYDQHVAHVAGRMFTRRLRGATEPFYQLRRLFNVHRVHLASPASGIDDPSSNTTVDTPLDGTTRCAELGGVCYVDTAKAKAAVDAALMGTDIVPDVIVVTLNTSMPVEGAVVDANGRFAIYGGGPTDDDDVNTSERGLRQIARAFAGLELTETGMGAYAGDEPAAANLTTSATGDKWARWMGFDSPHDEQSAVNAYEGGAGYATGIFRPVSQSKLSGEYPGPFDPVAREAIMLAVFDVIPAITQTMPSPASTQMNPQFLDAIPSEGNLVNVQWYVDGVDTTVTGGRFGFLPWAQAMGVSFGPHTVDARYSTRTRFRYPDCRRCEASTIDFVRAPSATMTGTVSWQVIYRR